MTIAVDFDVPIHAYDRGWQDGSIYGGETPGAFDALRSLLAFDAVFVFTSRDPQQVSAWLRERGGFETIPDTGDLGIQFWNQRGVLLVTRTKYPAHCYVDDRAVPFTGDWQAAITGAAAFAPILRQPPPEG
ncbi:hypothetical protein AB0M39_41145 [Streptomyces sp. NPDC051907]|uniref:hypothetical protein n=1 Tax=Streptomyces sp. NPDC051907 TaxID=3155284 RepID=UPI00344A02FB